MEGSSGKKQDDVFRTQFKQDTYPETSQTVTSVLASWMKIQINSQKQNPCIQNLYKTYCLHRVQIQSRLLCSTIKQ